MTYDFDKGYLDIAPIFAFTGAAGVLLTTYFTIQIAAVHDKIAKQSQDDLLALPLSDTSTELDTKNALTVIDETANLATFLSAGNIL